MLMFRPAISQYSSCPLILFPVTASNSQEACDFYHNNDDILPFFPSSAFISQLLCLKVSFLLVLSHWPLIPVKKLSTL